jgi:hypothetical protein
MNLFQQFKVKFMKVKFIASTKTFQKWNALMKILNFQKFHDFQQIQVIAKDQVKFIK